MRTFIIWMCLSASAYAEDAASAEDIAIFDMIQAGGLVAYAIIIVSIICLSLAIQLFLRLKQERASIDQVRQRFIGKPLQETEQAALVWAKQDQSLMGGTLRAGLEAHEEHREAAIQDEAAHYSGDLFRRADYLLFIGNTAPMLGLLGTVFGMMTSFNVLATQGGVSDPGELAGGISGALVTTCMGLIVALPALIFYTMLRNRIEVLNADVGRCIEHILFPERRRTAAVKPAAAATELKPATGTVKKVYLPQQDTANDE